ncbi:LysM peptidoglycan-binding domain-containing protein [Galactobacter caseinivorans]|uniref:LysM peptidoglycan-binding domain-containing protein n=1 Tax=Galactobacter caseinivorans TaxID=2676123 RepID=A0A496PMK5_9MICC|nr:LysM peptidoglycan-binding domain-containing protein [Galactobacter caseinivorans]RKW71654.1 LysM peptidoglycan-binding domain-containing protein [Galactobacter caseinivorans]
MPPISSRRRHTLQGALVTAAIPVITMAGIGLNATAAQAAGAPAGKAPTARNIFEARTQVAAHVKAAKAAQRVVVTVKNGDSVWSIATRHNVSVDSVLKLNKLRASTLIHPGDKLVVKAGSVSSGSKAGAARSGAKAKPAASNAKAHTVRSGDTLSGISHRYGVSLSTLLRANGLKASSLIYPGQSIKLAGGASHGTAPQPAANHKPRATTTSTSKAAVRSGGSYTIKAGDTLGSIAARNKVSLASLLKANGLQATSVIYAGRTLKLSGAGNSAPAKSGSSASTSTGSIPKTFLHYTYSDSTNRNANASQAALRARSVPSPAQMRAIVASTARKMGVDPNLAVAHAMVESGLNARAVSPANAVGVMQVMPGTGEWMGQSLGRKLNLLDPYDNVTAGVAYIRYLQRNASSRDQGIGAYYQGLAGVKRGMKSDTKDYVAKVRRAMGA